MILLDFRGVQCPKPLIDVLKKLAEVGVGETVVMLTNFRECVESLRNIVESIKLGDFSVSEEGDYFRVAVKKVRDADLGKREVGCRESA